MSEEEEVGFQVTDEEVVQDLDTWKDDQGVVPKAGGVRVRIEKPEVRISFKDNSKDSLPKGSPDNPWAYKYLNMQFRILEGIETAKKDEGGNPTGEVELQYKNKVVFPQRMDLVFAHNPLVKTTDWWMGRKYLSGFKSLMIALGFDLKEIRVNDAFLDAIKDRETLIDIEHEENQEKKGTDWVGIGTFRERIRKFQKWE